MTNDDNEIKEYFLRFIPLNLIEKNIDQLNEMSLSLENLREQGYDNGSNMKDTESIYTTAHQTVLEKYGKTFDWDTKSKIMGLKGGEMSKLMVKLFSLPVKWEEYYNNLQEQYAILFKDVQLMPGAQKLIYHLHKHKIPMAIATSSSYKSFDMKVVNYLYLLNMFEVIVVGGSDPEVKQGKPFPDIFLVAASRFSEKPSPQECLVLEDAPNGIEAALRAGMQVVMVPEPHVSEKLRKGAHLVVSSLEKFDLSLFGLPKISCMI